MRHLDAEIIVEPLRGGLRLRLVCATGEKFYMTYSAIVLAPFSKP